MKKIIISFFTIILVQSIAFADVIYAPLDSENAVIQQSERKADTERWHSVLGKKKIEIVYDGEIKEKYKVYADKISHLIDLGELDILQVRDLYLDKSGITYSEDGVSIPFVTSVSYKSGIIPMATMNTTGEMLLELDGNRVSNIDLIYFSDSNGFEEFGRKYGAIDNYDAQFLENVAVNVLHEMYQNEKYLSDLVRVTGLNLSVELN